MNLLNPQTEINYLIKKHRQCTIFDYLRNSKNDKLKLTLY